MRRLHYLVLVTMLACIATNAQETKSADQL
jgi:hypothetical protein